ncbi:hypothetical protein ACFL21_01955 [Patescibacteria group bacterium]
MGILLFLIALILAIYLLIVGIKSKNKKLIVGSILIIAFSISGTFWVVKEMIEFNKQVIDIADKIT